ncbi:TIGR03086 family metal-binding protein [Cumulibacter soli]|uniref:TIGR03086 family metal-binding protein n=1 Tax=Cumulibacter soli TaxID=2546344 RepID=UPI0010675E76|nr:TIGR03086 family metal-binding protein [Cumulibacter soli]
MTTDQNTTASTLAHLRPVLRDLAAVAGRVEENHLGLPTPCAEYDVSALSAHIVGWLENFAGGYADPDGVCPLADVSSVSVTRQQAAERIDTAAVTLDNAVQAGAAERPLVISQQGGMPGDMALSMILGEYLVHGWDLARATGQSWTPDDEASETSLTFFGGMVTPEYRGDGGMFAAEVAVPENAPIFDRLLGFAGRNPDWTP